MKNKKERKNYIGTCGGYWKVSVRTLLLLLVVFSFVVFAVGGWRDARLENTETLSGVDADGNGIRDDVDLFIASKYGTNTIAVKAAQTSARAHQEVLTTDPSNMSAARAVLLKSGDAGVCAGRGFRSVDMYGSKELKEIFYRTYNTEERLAHHRAVSAKAGQFEGSVTSVVCP